MDLPPSAAPSTARSKWWIVGVLLAVVVAGGAVVGWMHVSNVRAMREAMAQRERADASSAKASDDLLAARALANYLAKIRAQVLDHEAAFSRLQKQNALAWNIHERTNIERDRQIIRDFLTTNARLADTLQNGEGFIRAELDTAKVPATVRESALTLYAKTEKPLLPLQMRVRDCDRAIAENALAVLDLLDFSWGAWQRDDATGVLEFTNTVTLATFKDYVGKIESAAVERTAAQEELTNYQKHHPPPHVPVSSVNFSGPSFVRYVAPLRSSLQPQQTFQSHVQTEAISSFIAPDDRRADGRHLSPPSPTGAIRRSEPDAHRG